MTEHVRVYDTDLLYALVSDKRNGIQIGFCEDQQPVAPQLIAEDILFSGIWACFVAHDKLRIAKGKMAAGALHTVPVENKLGSLEQIRKGGWTLLAQIHRPSNGDCGSGKPGPP